MIYFFCEIEDQNVDYLPVVVVADNDREARRKARKWAESKDIECWYVEAEVFNPVEHGPLAAYEILT